MRLRLLSKHKSISKYHAKSKQLLQSSFLSIQRTQRRTWKFGLRLQIQCLRSLIIPTNSQKRPNSKCGQEARKESFFMSLFIWHFTQTKEFQSRSRLNMKFERNEKTKKLLKMKIMKSLTDFLVTLNQHWNKMISFKAMLGK